MASKKSAAQNHVKMAERYIARLNTPAGERHAEGAIAHMIFALMDVEVTREEGSIERARATSACAAIQKTAWQEVKILRSDAAYDLHAEGFTLDQRCHYLGGVKRAREDQIRKQVSGGKYQTRIYRERFAAERQ